MELLKLDLVIKGAIAAFTVVAFILWYFDVFHYPPISKGVFPGMHDFIFLPFQTDIKNINDCFHDFFQRLDYLTAKTNITALKDKNYRVTGIYYDNPNALSDPNEMRFIIGVALNQILTNQEID